MEYIVTKTVEIYYTIEADSHKEAKGLAEEFGFSEADEFSTVSIHSESIEEYEDSINTAGINQY
jgi:hypothetical protein